MELPSNWDQLESEYNKHYDPYADCDGDRDAVKQNLNKHEGIMSDPRPEDFRKEITRLCNLNKSAEYLINKYKSEHATLLEAVVFYSGNEEDDPRCKVANKVLKDLRVRGKGKSCQT